MKLNELIEKCVDRHKTMRKMFWPLCCHWTLCPNWETMFAVVSNAIDGLPFESISASNHSLLNAYSITVELQTFECNGLTSIASKTQCEYRPNDSEGSFRFHMWTLLRLPLWHIFFAAFLSYAQVMTNLFENGFHLLATRSVGWIRFHRIPAMIYSGHFSSPLCIVFIFVSFSFHFCVIKFQNEM